MDDWGPFLDALLMTLGCLAGVLVLMLILLVVNYWFGGRRK